MFIGAPVRQTESSCSSPTKTPAKSPAKMRLQHDQGLKSVPAGDVTPQGNVFSTKATPQRTIGKTPLDQHAAFPAPTAPPASSGRRFTLGGPDPAASDGAPNMGDVTNTTSGGGWQIPAVRSRPSSPQKETASTKPGAVAKLGRREAWVKFMAYEGSMQLCLDAVLQGNNSEPAGGFLVDGCRTLRQALDIGQLLLAPSSHSGAEPCIYWDDRDDTQGELLEYATQVKEDLLQRAYPMAAGDSPKKARFIPSERALAEAQSAPEADIAPVPGASPARSVGSVDTRGFDSDAFGVPFVEASVVRVVGCPFLSGYGDTGSASGRPAQGFYIVLHPSGTSVEGYTQTKLTPSGGIAAPGAMALSPDAPRGTVLVELMRNGEQLAAGTVQVVELQRLAAQCDALVCETPTSASGGFLKQLVPASWRRRDHGSSMSWVKLVDGDGAEAGHVVLAAKVTPGEASLQSGLGKRAAAATGMNADARCPSPESPEAGGVFIPPPVVAPQPAATPPRQPAAKMPLPVDESMPMLPLAVFRGAQVKTQTAGGYLHVKAQQVYDALLEAALNAAGCGPTTSLVLHGPWAWLAGQFADRYGVREQYATLAHLRWVVRRGAAAPTAACLETLVSELAPLMAQRESLTSAEGAVLGHVLERINALLTSCFENYYALNEDPRTGGVADGALAVRAPGTPAALKPAAALLMLTRGDQPGPEGASAWLSARLRSAARKRFQGLLAAAETRRRVAGARDAKHPQDDQAAATAFAYARVEELCTSVMNELRADDGIHNSRVIPAGICLPDVTAVEYIRGVTSHLQRTLQRHPPPAPTAPAVQLVESVGRLQSFVERHKYAEASARLNSREIFGGFVQEWVAGSAVSLRRTLRSLDRAGPPVLTGWADLQTGGTNRVSPLVESMLSGVEAEMKRYHRIVSHWPVHGMELEAAMVAVLREATSAASRQCGLVQTKEEAKDSSAPDRMPADNSATHGSPGKVAGRRGGRVSWRWVQVGPKQSSGGGEAGTGGTSNGTPSALRRGTDPHQALLLNSLRRLLAVVPQMEHALAQWCGGAAGASDLPEESMAVFPPVAAGSARIAREAPDLGAHWAQLVKELRTEYYACITLCAEALAGELAGSPATSVAGLLRREGLTIAPTSVARHLRRVLDQTAPTLRWLSAALDGRVFIALGRGLWDLAARDVLRYAEDLSETGTQGAWRGRQSAGAALKALDTFYRGELATAMGSDLHDRDLAPPQHAQRAGALLADNTVEVNMSFDVY